MKIEFEWETIAGFEDSLHINSSHTQRAKVIGGWIVSDLTRKRDCITQSSIFIPDPEYKWEIE